ncbi:enoyl-CoA hydratase/isomerase family protein [Nocardioides gilvus]|uniref:enoyl-CoA hydratase/isomerase family protein n=1 Tax=Nocardioides gilvus TaxID=1735589 RepID=UPI000D7462B5|nr:enoyl-CoA hydratase/isomerase family protein [Nocardioides gilvus]
MAQGSVAGGPTSEGPVTYDVADGVAHLQLNRPDAANALDMALATALREATEWAQGDDDVRAVLLTGAGKRFCGGGDVASFAAAEDQATFLYALAVEADAAVRALEALSKPVVAAVQGAVAGAGLAIMLAADVIVAAAGTKFVFAYPGIGLTPDCGVSWLLPRAIGQQRALSFALANKPIGPETALEWGLVAEVVDEGVDASVRAGEIAAGFAAGPAGALGQARRLLRAGWSQTREEMGLEEARTISAMVTGDEAQGLINAFVSR